MNLPGFLGLYLPFCLPKEFDLICGDECLELGQNLYLGFAIICLHCVRGLFGKRVFELAKTNSPQADL